MTAIVDALGRVPMKEAARFRKFYLMPIRKLKSRQMIERFTGRDPKPTYFRSDFNARLEVREPRKLEMETNQHWPDVWPSAATFKYSVVPLPLRMGYTKNPRAKPPRQAEANLELMKIPNFLHLTPGHIIQHCASIKKFCTPFPKELDHSGKRNNLSIKARAGIYRDHLPVITKYSDYVHQGTSIRDNRSRVVTLSLNVSRLQLDTRGWEKFKRLAGRKYVEETNMLTLTSDRCPTRKQNRDYVDYLLTALYFESKKKEPWEETMRKRTDDVKLQLAGSTTEKHIQEYFKGASPEGLSEFGKEWRKYRNKPESPETIRMYADAVKNLLGIKKARNVAVDNESNSQPFDQ